MHKTARLIVLCLGSIDPNYGTFYFLQSGAFIVLKTEADKETDDPPLWKIDGKALLQKYIPFEQDGKTLYKNTSVVSWPFFNLICLL